MRVVVTGGRGFIGSHLIDYLLMKPEIESVLNVDWKTSDKGRPRYRESSTDITARGEIMGLMHEFAPHWVFHLAAHTHVDTSIKFPSSFVDNNVTGTVSLLETFRLYPTERFLYVSTDEVYGPTIDYVTEGQAFAPSSPYAASKAAADLLVQSYIKTYDFPALIVRPSNTYGPRQAKEKLIPKAIDLLTRNQKVPLYGNGHQKRTWLWVHDLVDALWLVMSQAKPGSIFNIGGSMINEMANIDLVRKIAMALHKPTDLIEFVENRPAHDWAYHIDSTAIRTTLGWKPLVDLDKGLEVILKNKLLT
jgi:dTDP-glucose 4,6-dehydratase